MRKGIESHDVGASAALSDEKSITNSNDVSRQAPLLGKHQRYIFGFFVLHYVVFTSTTNKNKK